MDFITFAPTLKYLFLIKYGDSSKWNTTYWIFAFGQLFWCDSEFFKNAG
jgi:hypothetical protein